MLKKLSIKQNLIIMTLPQISRQFDLAPPPSKYFGTCILNTFWLGTCTQNTFEKVFYPSLSNRAIRCLSKKQTTVALSTTEAEYVALSSAVQEAVCLRSLLDDLHVDISKPTLIYEYNQTAIAAAVCQNGILPLGPRSVRSRAHKCRMLKHNCLLFSM